MPGTTRMKTHTACHETETKNPRVGPADLCRQRPGSSRRRVAHRSGKIVVGSDPDRNEHDRTGKQRVDRCGIRCLYQPALWRSGVDGGDWPPSLCLALFAAQSEVQPLLGKFESARVSLVNEKEAAGWTVEIDYWDELDTTKQAMKRLCQMAEQMTAVGAAEADGSQLVERPTPGFKFTEKRASSAQRPIAMAS